MDINLKINDDLFKRLTKSSKQGEETLSDYIIKVLEEHIEEIEEKEEVENEIYSESLRKLGLNSSEIENIVKTDEE